MTWGLGVSQGVIRVHLLEAEKLAQKDNFLGLGGKSDPYAKVSIGLQHCRSRTIYKNLNPTWNEVFEVSSLPSVLEVLVSPGFSLGCDEQATLMAQQGNHG